MESLTDYDPHDAAQRRFFAGCRTESRTLSNRSDNRIDRGRTAWRMDWREKTSRVTGYLLDSVTQCSVSDDSGPINGKCLILQAMNDERGKSGGFTGFDAGSGDQLPGLASMVAGYAIHQPASVALECEGKRCTWAELEERCARLSNALLENGIGLGDRVAIVSAPMIEAVEAYLSITRAGACAVPLPTLASAETIRMMLQDSETKLVFASKSARALVEEALGIDEADVIPDCVRIGLDFSDRSWSSLDGFLANASPSCAATEIPPDTAFNIIYSSGTTGTPKGIVQSHRVRAYQAAGMASSYSDSDRRVALISTPVHSNLTLWGILTALWSGGTVVITPKFSEAGYLSTVNRVCPSHAFVVPNQLSRLLADPSFDRMIEGTRTLKICSGSPLATETKRAVVDRWPGGLLEVYGLTEGAPTTFLMAEDHMDKLTSVGRAAPGASVKIIDDDGRELPSCQVGEIVGYSRTMMDGYYERPKDSQEIVWYDSNGDRYFRSGDLGYLDEDGFLYVTDRKKDMIISGGANVYPSDIEAVLSRHPDVIEVAVVGVPDPDWGETPVAVVVSKVDSQEENAELLRWANSRLGRHQRLSAIQFRHELPRGNLDKVLKRELRREIMAARPVAPVAAQTQASSVDDVTDA